MAGVVTVEDLITSAYGALAKGDVLAASKYVDKALSMKPKHGEAHIVKLLCELQVCKEEALYLQERPFVENVHYKKAMQYCSKDRKEALIDCVYAQAARFYSVGKYRLAYELFGKISPWKDSRKRQQDCKRSLSKKKERTIIVSLVSVGLAAIVAVGGVLLYLYGDVTKDGIVYKRKGNTYVVVDYKAPLTKANIATTIRKKPVVGIEETSLSENLKLTEVVIPYGVTYIANNAFNSCRALTKVEIPEGITFIDSGAFSGCVSLEEVTLPRSLTYIGFYSFAYCEKLETVYYAGTVAEWGLVEIAKNEWHEWWYWLSPFSEVVCTDGVVEIIK